MLLPLSSDFISLLSDASDDLLSEYENLLNLGVFVSKSHETFSPSDHTCVNEKYAGQSYCCYTNREEFNCMPNVILLGVQKGASAELALWLSLNKEVTRYGAELHFFDQDLEKRSTKDFAKERLNILKTYVDEEDTPAADLMQPPVRSNQVVSQYLDHMYNYKGPRNPRYKGVDFNELLDRKRIFFEKTPAYFDETQPEDVASALIQTHNPKAVLLLRNPAKRFHSAYFHSCRFNAKKCDKNTFKQFADESLALRPGQYTGLRALSYGIYFLFLQKWIEVFAEKGVKFVVLFTEEFQAEPFQMMYDLESELELNHFDYSGGKHVHQVNGYWVVAAGSKASYEKKPVGYFKLEEYPEYKEKLNTFYNRSNHKLRTLLEEKKENGEVVILQKFPDWLQL
eukprot:snap_masked-scaffold_13-processed-gene-6.51-mRNA-1 protein AED:1.00 eAED:1.00 QI:0/-1/0/0/-1/1/1/0/396